MQPSSSSTTRPDVDIADPRFAPALAGLLGAWAARHGAMLAIKDAASGRYAYVSAAMAHFLGRPAAQIQGHADAELVDPALATAWRAADQTALAQAQPLHSEHRFEWAGARHDFAVSRVAVDGGAGGQRWVCSLWTDQAPQRQKDAQLRAALEQIEQQQRANEQLRRELADQGMRDAATGLCTRSHFEDQLRREVDLSTREHREFAMVLIEIDPLADKVRALGAPAEARVLEAMGRLLRGNTRAMDASCRLDERRFGGAAVGRGPGHRAFAHGRPAPPVRDADRRARRPGTGLHACRWAWPAFRTPPLRSRSCWPPARPRWPRRSAAAAIT